MQNTPPKQDHFQAIKNILKIYGDFYSKACYEFQFMVHVVLIPNNSYLLIVAIFNTIKFLIYVFLIFLALLLLKLWLI